MISFLNKDNNTDTDTPQGPVAKGDIIFLIVLAVIGIGIYLYSTRVKDVSYEQFDACISAYHAEKLAESQECFEDARDLHFINDSLDNLIYIHTSKLDEIEMAERSLFSKMEELSTKNDARTMQAILKRLPAKLHFLSAAQLDSISTWKARFLTTEGAPADSSAQMSTNSATKDTASATSNTENIATVQD